MGLGSATNKKDAETNAAKDFCGFLIGAGIIPPDSFPDDLFVSVLCFEVCNVQIVCIWML